MIYTNTHELSWTKIFIYMGSSISENLYLYNHIRPMTLLYFACTDALVFYDYTGGFCLGRENESSITKAILNNVSV